jgi:hypothetical protein
LAISFGLLPLGPGAFTPSLLEISLLYTQQLPHLSSKVTRSFLQNFCELPTYARGLAIIPCPSSIFSKDQEVISLLKSKV